MLSVERLDLQKDVKKRHQKCQPKMFGNETWESLVHEDMKAALVKEEASKVAAAKKKGTRTQIGRTQIGRTQIVANFGGMTCRDVLQFWPLRKRAL